MSDAEQLSLFPSTSPSRARGRWVVPVVALPDRPLTAESSLGLAIHWFDQEMQRLGMAKNTRKAYTKAVRLLSRYLGSSRLLSQIATDDLQRFQAWVETQARSPKTAELKLTAARRFFVALYEAGILPANVASDMYPLKAHPPLPTVLHPGQADAVRRVAAEQATHPEDQDPLPALLITLLLDMGLRLGEAERLHVDDIDLSNPLRPIVHIRYDDQRHRAKQRALVGPPLLFNLVEQQREHLGPDGTRLLGSSRRCLQYVLERIGEQVGLRRSLTANTLRWTYALDQFRAGLDPETLRRRLGLSELGWRDIETRLQVLARRAL